MNIQITGIFLLPIVSILTIVLLYPLRTIPKKYIGLFFTISSFVLFADTVKVAELPDISELIVAGNRASATVPALRLVAFLKKAASCADAPK